MNWMAPEVLEQAYDEVSDVWGLGCIILELATTAVCDNSIMGGKLCEIKHSAQALEELLTSISDVRQRELDNKLSRLHSFLTFLPLQ